MAGKPTPLPILDDWERQARTCRRSADPSDFFSFHGELGEICNCRQEHAVEFHRGCAVREPCVVFAADAKVRYGTTAPMPVPVLAGVLADNRSAES